MEFLPLLLPDLSEMPALQGRAEMCATDSEFCWTLRRFGLLFASEGVGLESREFQTENGEDKDSPHRSDDRLIYISKKERDNASCQERSCDSGLRKK